MASSFTAQSRHQGLPPARLLRSGSIGAGRRPRGHRRDETTLPVLSPISTCATSTAPRPATDGAQVPVFSSPNPEASGPRAARAIPTAEVTAETAPAWCGEVANWTICAYETPRHSPWDAPSNNTTANAPDEPAARRTPTPATAITGARGATERECPRRIAIGASIAKGTATTLIAETWAPAEAGVIPSSTRVVGSQVEVV